MADPLFTVIISTHNRSYLLSRAIGSVLDQTFKDFELLVIDNGSTDGTEEVVGNIADRRIIYFRNPCPTKSCDVPRNIGIKMAKGELVAFLDDDDIWYPARLEKVKKVFDDNSNAAAVCHYENLNVNGSIEKILRHGPWDDNMYEALLYERNRLSSCATTVKLNTIRNLNGFAEREELSEVADYDLWIRMVKTGARVYFIEEALGEFCLTGDNWSVLSPQFGIKQAEMIKTHILEYENRPLLNVSQKGLSRLAHLYLVAAKTLLRSGSYVKSVQCMALALALMVRKPGAVLDIYEKVFIGCD